MSYYKIPLLAGKAHTLDVAGRVLLIDSPGEGGSVDVALVVKGTPQAMMEGRKGGFKNIAPFDGVMLLSAVDTTVTLFLSFEDVNLGTNQLEISNSAANPVNVLFGGVVTPVLGTLTNTDVQAVPVRRQALSNIAAIAPVVVGVAAVPLVSDATLKRLTVRNASDTETVALGGAGVTLANSPIILQPGGVYIENDAAGAAWYAVASAAGVNVQIQGLK